VDLVKCCHRFICQHDALPPGEIMSKCVKIHGKTVVFLGPLEFRNLFYRKPRLRWLIDYAKHVMLGYYHHFGRMPDNRELVDIMSKLVRYRCKIFSTSDLGGRFVGAVKREINKLLEQGYTLDELVKKFYIDPLAKAGHNNPTSNNRTPKQTWRGVTY